MKITQTSRTVRTALLAVIAWTALALPASANDEKPLGVVELFTSQGCNSCPPADSFFNEMVQKGEVIALAYHVDYWDYLGWKDTLAKPENTERQYAYMRSFGDRSIYTPQLIVNGRGDFKGGDRKSVEDGLALFDKQGEGMVVNLTVSETKDSIIIKAGSTTQPAAEANLMLVYFEPPRAIDIDRGENVGRKAIYLNAVTGVRAAGVWHGKATEFELPKSEFDSKGGCAALLQGATEDGKLGPIVGAVLIRHP
ncbi:MAG: DUF1223 domain-containing protein [Rhizobiaceae bacterium]|nr:DUF1223 domain-containing protein [Rhizobiaceae bacterium]